MKLWIHYWCAKSGPLHTVGKIGLKGFFLSPNLRALVLKSNQGTFWNIFPITSHSWPSSKRSLFGPFLRLEMFMTSKPVFFLAVVTSSCRLQRTKKHSMSFFKNIIFSQFLHFIDAGKIQELKMNEALLLVFGTYCVHLQEFSIFSKKKAKRSIFGE